MNVNELNDERLAEILGSLDDDIQIPEDAARGWRAAIKKEARSMRINRAVRRVSAVAAAIAVIIGTSLFFRTSGVLDYRSDKGNVQLMSLPSANAPVVMLEADGEETYAKTSRAVTKPATGNEYVTGIVCSFESDTAQAAEADVKAALEGVEGYIESSELTDRGYSAQVRVLREDTDRFIDSLRELTGSLEYKTETRLAAEVRYDADERLAEAYTMEAELKTRMESADETERYAIYEQLKSVYNDIDELEALVSRYSNSDRYTLIEISASSGGFAGRLWGAVSGFVKGFGSDIAITTLILLPGFAVIAACAYIVIRKKKQN